MVTREFAAQDLDLHLKPYGFIIAQDVPYEVYLDDYAEHTCEWVKGYVLKMSPVNMKHDFYQVGLSLSPPPAPSPKNREGVKTVLNGF